MTDTARLDRLADLAGIESHYWDIWGNYYEASPETKRTILDALGIDVNGDGSVEQAIRDMEAADWRSALPPVVVLLADQPAVVPVVVPANRTTGDIDCELREEGGEVYRFTWAVDDAALDASHQGAGGMVERRLLALPMTPVLGYHELALGPPLNATTKVIVAPRQCYLPEGLDAERPVWGVAAHLYSLNSARNWGIGDFTDLAELASTAAKLGAACVGLNPLHALFSQYPEEASPYSPNSRLFLNPLYLDVEAIPDFAEADDAGGGSVVDAEVLARVRASTTVEYAAVASLKRQALERLYASFLAKHASKSGDARAADFERFREEAGDRLRRFAIFETLSETHPNTPWYEWPEPYRSYDSPEVADFAAANAERLGFQEYLQWQADRQLAKAQEQATTSSATIGLYRDLAIGASPTGADSWSEQDVLVHDGRVGAPPDPFNMLGQDWGIPPMHPRLLRGQAYQPFIALLRANMRHAGALRIDHVMGLKHLFWIPAGQPPVGGAYVSYPFDEMLAVLALESHRNRCLVIGEDLGTVPEGFRERMAECKVLSYRVLFFEKDGDRFKRPDEYPPLALSCVSTHDLPTLKGFWTCNDLKLKSRLGLYPSADAEAGDVQGRVHDRWLLLQALAAEGLLPDGVDPSNVDAVEMTPTLSAAIHAFLARSSAGLFMVQIDDLCAEAEQLNLPGTVDERPNWRRRLSIPLDAVADAPMWKAVSKALEGRHAHRAR